MIALRQIVALTRLLGRHWTRSALTAGAAARAGGGSRLAGLALRLAFLLIVGRSFHQIAATAVREGGAAGAAGGWLLGGALITAAGFGAVQLLPALRGVKSPLRAELLETLPVTAAARVALALLQNVLGLIVCVSVALGAAAPAAPRPAVVALGLALYVAGALVGIGALSLVRLALPAHRLARLTWIAAVAGVLGVLLLQAAPLLSRIDRAPWDPLLAPCARALAGVGSLLPALGPPALAVVLAVLAIAFAERRGYDRLAAPPPGKARFAAPKRMTPGAVDRLLTAREMSVVVRTLVLAIPPLAILGLVIATRRTLRPREIEAISLGASLVILQIASTLGLSIAGRSALRDARARPLLAPLTIVPADTLAGKESSLRRLLLAPALAPFLLVFITPAGSLPVVLARAASLAAGLAIFCSAATSMAFLTNGLGSAQPGGGAPISPATVLLLMPLASAVIAGAPGAAVLSLLLLGAFAFEARRAALRCVRWLDDESDDVERDTPVWRALLVLGAFFSVQALSSQLLAFLFSDGAPGLTAGLTYAAGAVALLLLTVSTRKGRKLAWIPEKRRWLLVVGPLAGVASGALAHVYLGALRRLGVELPASPPVGGADLIALGVAVVLVAPVAEEVFFRGWLQDSIAGELPDARRRLAPLIAAIGFALVHPSLSFLPVLVLGCVAGELFAVGGALLPAILAHAAHNAVAMLVVP